MTSLLELRGRIDRLTGDARERAERLLEVEVISGRTDPPPELVPWLESTFGSIVAVKKQTVVKVTNLATLDATLFAPLRSRRPMEGGATANLDAEIAASRGDPFCHPETGTPAEAIGRVRGLRMLTGANAALADAHHAVLVFDDHDPRAFDAELVGDLFATGRAWADRVRSIDAQAANYLLVWNCLWRAGGSIVHGHAQALLGSGRHYARIERFRRDADRYAATHGAPLASDLVGLHRDVGLAIDGDSGVSVLAHLTPLKEREVIIVGRPEMDERDPAFVAAVAGVLLAYRDRLGVASFNLGLWRTPITADGSPANGWEMLPPMVRLVDRGSPASRASDIGSMELYGTPVVGTDPYLVVEQLADLSAQE